MVNKQETKVGNKDLDKTTGLYKIAAKIIKKVKTGTSYKTQLYQAQYPNKLLLNAVLMNVFKWEKVIDLLVEKSKILEKENNMDPELVYVLITELMWSKFGLKGNAKNIVAIKKYKNEFSQLLKENELVKLTNSIPTKVSKPRFFRINTLVTTTEDILKKLSQHKLKKLETPKTYAEFLELIKSDEFKGNTFVQDVHIKELLVFNSKVKFYKLEEYNNGSLIIQDKASCLAAHLLNPEPGSTVLDMCAAPGMKTSHLAAIMQNTGKLYAVDRCKERYNVMQNMLEKYGVKNVETFNMDALTFPYYDDVKYILVDPSCSGSGIVDRVRNDSIGQNDQLQIRLKKLANVHAQLLNHALKSYPKLERLVYSTCSANHEENEKVVDEALSVNGKFKLLDGTKLVKGWMNKGVPGYDCSEMCLNAVPNVDCTNGFFIAVFVRRDFEEKEIIDDEVSEITNENPSEVSCNEFSEDIDEKMTEVGDPKTEIISNSPLETKKTKNKKKKAIVKIENPKQVKKKETSKVINEDLSEINNKEFIDEEITKDIDAKTETSTNSSQENKKRKNKKKKAIMKIENPKLVKKKETSKVMNEDLFEDNSEEFIDEKISKDIDARTETNENSTQERKKKNNKKKPIVKMENLVENQKPLKKRKAIERNESPKSVKKCKTLVNIENTEESSEPSKKRKVIENNGSPKSAKKCKTLVNIENTVENSEPTKKKKGIAIPGPIKKIKTVNIEETKPIKKSKNVKRRERRLKLEQANGVTTKTKKSKKPKKEII